MAILRFLQDGSRPQCWICDVCVQTTHEGYLVFFVAAQNLVGIDAVVLIIRMFFVFGECGLKTPIQSPKIVFWGT